MYLSNVNNNRYRLIINYHKETLNKLEVAVFFRLEFSLSRGIACGSKKIIIDFTMYCPNESKSFLLEPEFVFKSKFSSGSMNKVVKNTMEMQS